MIAPEMLDDLEAKAKAATPGPWKAAAKAFAVYRNKQRICSAAEIYAADVAENVTREKAHANVTFIAAANPRTVLELIDEFRTMRELLQDFWENIPPKLDGSCPYCHTRTHKMWCLYPELAMYFGANVDGFDKNFLEQIQKREKHVEQDH